jgi:cytochrome b
MFRKSSSQSHLPLLALLVFALIISLATLVCAATTLNLFESQQSTNPWLLPFWRNHFDLRGLKLVVGTSVAIALFDLVSVVALLLLAAQVSLNATISRS